MKKRGIDLTCGERTPAGRFLPDLIMSLTQDSTPLLKREEYFASIYNGGRHEFILFLSYESFAALVDIIEASFGHEKGCDEFIKFARQKFA